MLVSRPRSERDWGVSAGISPAQLSKNRQSRLPKS
jgi:hypothetical protein